MIEMLCKQVRGYLSEQGLSPARLEKKAELKPGTLRNILYQNSTNPTAETLIKLSKAMDMSIDSLVMGKPSIVLEGQSKDTMNEVELLMKIAIFLKENRPNLPINDQFFTHLRAIYDYCMRYHNGKFDQAFARHTVESDL
ncbi:MAG: hypothetical protein CMM87_00285 [Rickettsiales bacterium]|nr:hypothetical protein [Rickettsiales bacterium]